MVAMAPGLHMMITSRDRAGSVPLQMPCRSLAGDLLFVASFPDPFFHPFPLNQLCLALQRQLGASLLVFLPCVLMSRIWRGTLGLTPIKEMGRISY